MNEPVHRHHWIVRLTHWCAFALIFGMITSGLQIYRAYPRFGERGGPYYPNAFQDFAFPEWMRLGGWLAGGLNWHFFLMWPLIGIGALYLGYLLASGRSWSFLDVIEWLRLKKDHPPQGKHILHWAYTLIVLSERSRFYRFRHMEAHPVTWLAWMFGGYQAARYWHFWAVWIRGLHGGACLSGVRLRCRSGRWSRGGMRKVHSAVTLIVGR